MVTWGPWQKVWEVEGWTRLTRGYHDTQFGHQSTSAHTLPFNPPALTCLLVLPPVLHAVLLGAAITSLCCTAGLALQLSSERRRHGSDGNHPGQLSSCSRCVTTFEQCNMQHMHLPFYAPLTWDRSRGGDAFEQPAIFSPHMLNPTRFVFSALEAQIDVPVICSNKPSSVAPTPAW